MKQQQKQNQQLKQGYYLSHQHMKLMHLMHLSGYALQEYLSNELEQNPALEVESESDNTSSDENDNKEDNVFDEELFNNDDDLFDKNYKQPVQHDEYYEAPVVHYSSLNESLKEQLHMLHLSEEISAAACYIIDELDDDGYLRRTLEDAAFDYGFSKGKLADEFVMEKALEAVQRCEPAGIGARNLQECLLLQLRHKKQASNKSTLHNLALHILDEHYQHFVQRQFQKIKTALHITEEQFEECIAYISKLNPKPITEANKYELLREVIIPDFEVSIEGESVFVSLSSSDYTKLRVNNDFATANLSTHNSTEQKQAENYFQNFVSDATALISALRERETSMIRIMSCMVQMQLDFFKCGDVQALKPMILHDIATATGYDISTVSRITSNKYVQTPFGIFSLKNLFMRGLNADENSGSATTAIRIQELIQQIINNEDKAKPLSDSEIVEALKVKGTTIARRTVVKYREALKIPNSTFRKIH